VSGKGGGAGRSQSMRDRGKSLSFEMKGVCGASLSVERF